MEAADAQSGGSPEVIDFSKKAPKATCRPLLGLVSAEEAYRETDRTARIMIPDLAGDVFSGKILPELGNRFSLKGMFMHWGWHQQRCTLRASHALDGCPFSSLCDPNPDILLPYRRTLGRQGYPML